MASTRGEKELRTDWDELGAEDPDKAIGVLQLNLVPEEGSTVRRSTKKGID